MNCEECQAPFLVTAAEVAVMRKVFAPPFTVPAVTKCPDCRMRQRLSFRNERKLYRRNCALSGKQIISVYRPESPYLVYDQNVWWSDAYDPLSYGRAFDFTRPFFEQLDELHRAVPKLSIHNAKSENCDYTNYSTENRNCYLIVGGLEAQDCMYCYRVFYSKNCSDSFGISRSELLYECVQGADLYRCAYATNCYSSSNLFLCDDCIGCHDCFGCAQLRNQKYCIFNESFEPEVYQQKVRELRANVPSARATYARLLATLPVRSTYKINCEDVRGDQVRNCRRCSDVYFMYDSEDVSHSRNGDGNRDCVDCNFCDNCELQYQATNLEKNYRVAFSALAWYVSDSFYVLSCFNSKNLFGCCGMKKHERCILNAQYSSGEYQTMLTKIAVHMQDTGEWGKYLPATLSPFLFSETVAAELFPLSEQECNERGYAAGVPVVEAPGNQNTAAARLCRQCSRAFRIIPQEEAFYESLNLSPPEVCPDCRHRERLLRRRPMELRAATCAYCENELVTTAPSGEVICEDCAAEGLT